MEPIKLPSLDAELGPEAHREILELAKLVRLAPNSRPVLPSLATTLLVLEYFVDPRKPTVSRRWVGLLLLQVLVRWPAENDPIQSAPKATRHALGTIVFSKDCEDVKIVAGRIIRLELSKGCSQDMLWGINVEWKAQSAFPRDEKNWIDDFVNFMDSVGDGSSDAELFFALQVKDSSTTPLNHTGRIMGIINTEQVTFVYLPSPQELFFLDVSIAQIIDLELQSAIPDVMLQSATSRRNIDVLSLKLSSESGEYHWNTEAVRCNKLDIVLADDADPKYIVQEIQKQQKSIQKANEDKATKDLIDLLDQDIDFSSLSETRKAVKTGNCSMKSSNNNVNALSRHLQTISPNASSYAATTRAATPANVRMRDQMQNENGQRPSTLKKPSVFANKSMLTKAATQNQLKRPNGSGKRNRNMNIDGHASTDDFDVPESPKNKRQRSTKATVGSNVKPGGKVAKKNIATTKAPKARDTKAKATSSKSTQGASKDDHAQPPKKTQKKSVVANPGLAADTDQLSAPSNALQLGSKPREPLPRQAKAGLQALDYHAHGSDGIEDDQNGSSGGTDRVSETIPKLQPKSTGSRAVQTPDEREFHPKHELGQDRRLQNPADLIADECIRKPPVISFGTKGPLNQGTPKTRLAEEKQGQSNGQASLMQFDDIEEDDTPLDPPSIGFSLNRANVEPSAGNTTRKQVKAPPADPIQDSLEDFGASLPGNSSEEPEEPSGSQLSARVDADGSPYPRDRPLQRLSVAPNQIVEHVSDHSTHVSGHVKSPSNVGRHRNKILAEQSVDASATRNDIRDKSAPESFSRVEDKVVENRIFSAPDTYFKPSLPNANNQVPVQNLVHTTGNTNARIQLGSLVTKKRPSISHSQPMFTLPHHTDKNVQVISSEADTDIESHPVAEKRQVPNKLEPSAFETRQLDEHVGKADDKEPVHGNQTGGNTALPNGQASTRKGNELHTAVTQASITIISSSPGEAKESLVNSDTDDQHDQEELGDRSRFESRLNIRVSNLDAIDMIGDNTGPVQEAEWDDADETVVEQDAKESLPDKNSGALDDEAMEDNIEEAEEVHQDTENEDDSSSRSGSSNELAEPNTPTEEQIEWEQAVNPHHSGIVEVLGKISKGLLLHLSDSETAIKNMVDDLKSNGSKLIQDFELAHAEDYRIRNKAITSLRAQTARDLTSQVAGHAADVDSIKQLRTETTHSASVTASASKACTAEVRRLIELYK